MTKEHKNTQSNKITRRTLLMTASAAGASRFIPKIATSSGGRRVLTVYFDKAMGSLRAIEKLIP
jgi:hypothetical protein